MRRWDALANEYMAMSTARGLAEPTLDAWRRDLDKVGIWLKRRKPKPRIEDINGDLIIRYIRCRTAFRSKSTVCSVISRLRGFGDFLVEKGMWRENPLKWIRGPKMDPRMRLPKRIGRKELEKLWEAAAEMQRLYLRHRMLCLLSLLYATGLRRGELVSLDVDDWNREEAVLKIDGQKTGRERQIPVGESVWRCVEAYLPYRHNELEKLGRVDEKALFVNRTGGRIADYTITHIIRNLCRKAGLPRINCHQFRHSCASDLLENGIKLPQVQQMLGHAVITTTMRYLDISDPHRREAMNAHPINGFLAGSKAMERSA